MVEATTSLELADLSVLLKNSSVNYHILSYLTVQQVTKLQLVNRRFYSRFVPTALSNKFNQMSKKGTIPISRRQLTWLATKGEQMAVQEMRIERQAKKREPTREDKIATSAGAAWDTYKLQWQQKRLRVLLRDTNGNPEEREWFHFGKHQAGATVVVDPVDRSFIYVIGGVNDQRQISKLVTKACLRDKLSGYDHNEYVRFCRDLPEPRFQHAAVIVQGHVIVTGGFSTFEIDMTLYSQPPCEQKVFAMHLYHKDPCWFELPAMANQGSQSATLICIQNRYVYQIGGSNPFCKNVSRLDFNRRERGWHDYTIHDKFVKVPRHYLDHHSRAQFDREHIDMEQGASSLIEDTQANEEQCNFWERSPVKKALNKVQMGVLHVPQKTNEASRPEVDENEISFLVFGGMSYSDEITHSTTYLLTLKHDQMIGALAKLPNAELPECDTFKGNAALTVFDTRVALVGLKAVLGLDLNLNPTQFEWRHIDRTDGQNSAQIPHPDDVWAKNNQHALS